MGTWWKETRPVWCDHIVSELNLFLTNIVSELNLFLTNNMYLLIGVVPFQSRYLGTFRIMPSDHTTVQSIF